MKNHYFRLLMFLIFDYLAALFSLSASFLISDNLSLFGASRLPLIFNFIVWPSILILVLYIFKIYNILWRFSGFYDFIRIILASLVSLAIFFIAQMAVFNKRYPLHTYVLCAFFVICAIILGRYFYKLYAIHKHEKEKLSTTNTTDDSFISGNVLVIGAGSAGETIINEISNKKEYFNSKIKCVIDDDLYKIGKYISGVKIVGGREDIIDAVKRYEISNIIFAIPSANLKDKTEIIDICQKTGCNLKILPSICRLYNPGDLSSLMRKVEIEDLLGRDLIEINTSMDLDYLKDKVVLVTGGGGTIGSELCRQIALHSPKQLIIFDIYENNAYEIQNELRYSFPKLNLVTLIGSVRDSKRLNYLFKTYKPNIVFHAAAHKHVPLMEDSPNETIKNNVFGTFKTAQCADSYGVEKFVLISTDKAVNPTNIMGASKRICEMIVQSFNTHSDTDFVAVRFGNVLGSNGSVIPLFKKQISHGGPVTVTHPNIIRYFMTISEAVSLVLQAGANAHGGEIFVLDMGKPVKILDLAENLIKLSGFTPYKDIKIEFTGLRPGEKLYEELLMSEEGLTETDNSLIFIGKPIDINEQEFSETLQEMKNVMYDESSDIRLLIKKIVPTYNPESSTLAKN